MVGKDPHGKTASWGHPGATRIWASRRSSRVCHSAETPLELSKALRTRRKDTPPPDSRS